MEAIHWKTDFATGLKDVDEQHHHLIDIINDLNTLLFREEISDQVIEDIYAELVFYIETHFRDEETLMENKGIHSSHLVDHRRVHESFVDEVNFLHTNIYKDNHDHVKYLLDFLTHWLVYHILGIDQNMARQLHAIDTGVSSEQAHRDEEKTVDSQTKSLLIALNSLFELVSAKNKELVTLNRSLEKKVAERTEELARINRQLEELSLTDPLTQLPNRRHAMQLLSSLWRESVESGQPLLCMLIDADNFKLVNDKYGHHVGDDVLVELAKALRQSYRSDDIVSRLGGDEFLVICPNTDIKGGMHIAAIVLQSVAKLKVPTGGEPWMGSISIGIAERTNGINDFIDLIKAADSAVYDAKESGKNCIRTA